MKQALITGIAGQDGSYLAELLVSMGYAVTGIVLGNAPTSNLAALVGKAKLVEGDVLDEVFLREQVSKQFDEIYNLASVSTVQSPWEDPVGAVRSCGLAPLVILEAIRTSSTHTRFFQASSAEMYGDPVESPQTENTPFQPRSPYGWGKLLAHQAAEGYRTTHNIFAVSGILFNHESPRRGEHFVTRKITSTLARIARGSGEVLQLGNLDAKRDWSFAGDIVRGMWMSLQTEKSGSYVFASGEVHTVREFVEVAARALSMNISWEGKGVEEKGFDEKGRIMVAVNPDFYRPVEKTVRCGDISLAERELGWSPDMSFKTLVELMIKADSGK